MFRLKALGFLVALAIAAPLAAQPHECANADFQGRYGFHGIGSDTRSYPVLPLALAGSIVADGQGTITYWSDFAHFGLMEGPPKYTEMNDFVSVVRSAGREVTYSVESDCRMTITIPLPAPAPTLRLQGVLVDGGRTARLLTGSPAYVGQWTAYKADNPAAGDLNFLKDLLRRLARRQGLLGVEELPN